MKTWFILAWLLVAYYDQAASLSLWKQWCHLESNRLNPFSHSKLNLWGNTSYLKKNRKKIRKNWMEMGILTLDQFIDDECEQFLTHAVLTDKYHIYDITQWQYL